MSDGTDDDLDEDDFERHQKDERTGQFVSGNSLWRKALNAYGRYGANPTIPGPDDLMARAGEYFADLEENPLLEQGIYGKDANRKNLAKMRAPTIKGLCSHIGVAERTWRDWRASREDLKPAIEFLEQVIYVMKLEGAAAGFLNHSIIAREMGLADTQALTGVNGGPIQLDDVTPVNSDLEVARRLAFLLASAMNKQKQTDQADSDNEPG